MPPLGKIAVAFDGSAAAIDALVLGELLARTMGSALLVVRADPGSGEPAPAATAEISADVDSRLAGSPLDAEVRVIGGRSAAGALHEFAAAEPGLGMLVVGSTHRVGAGRLVPGGMADRLLSGSPCPVAVAPHGFSGERAAAEGGALPSAQPLRVLAAGWDGSREADTALELAVAIAGLARATLRVMAIGSPVTHVVPTSAGMVAVPPRHLQEEVHEVVAKLPEDLRALAVYEMGEPARELLAHMDEGVDLLALGSRGYGPLRSVLLGGVSRVVIAEAPCPVVVTPRPHHADG